MSSIIVTTHSPRLTPPPLPPRNPRRIAPASPPLPEPFSDVPAGHQSPTFHLFEAMADAHRALFHGLPRAAFAGRLQREGVPARLVLVVSCWKTTAESESESESADERPENPFLDGEYGDWIDEEGDEELGSWGDEDRQKFEDMGLCGGLERLLEWLAGCVGRA